MIYKEYHHFSGYKKRHWDMQWVDGSWDLGYGRFVGQRAQVNLIDASSGAWGHINFDDLNGDIDCEQI